MGALFNKGKTLIGIVVIGIVLYFAYSMLVSDSGDDGIETPAEQEARVLENELLLELERLQKIELSSDLFASPAFGALVDYSKPLPTPVIGRENPFAPRGSTQQSVVQEQEEAVESQ